MQETKDDPDLVLHSLISGAHLVPNQGETWREIETDGFSIDTKVKLDLEDNSNLGMAISVGQAIDLLSRALKKISPDILVILGDRYEAFAAATAGMLLQIPIAHIHGGETTEGVIDEAIRHSITKMAHIHFVAAEEYRNRIIQLGEEPHRVFNYGAPGLDGVQKLGQITREELSIFLGIKLNKKIFLVTYHPVTLNSVSSEQALNQLLETLNTHQSATIIFTKANADFGSNKINWQLEKFVKQSPKNRVLVESLGLEKYYSLIKLSHVVIGNSSSGIIEAPIMGTPTVNIGSRQIGRAQSPSVINCSESGPEITQAITKALSPAFLKIASRCISPYGSGGAAMKIVQTMKSFDLTNVLMKSFHNLDF